MPTIESLIAVAVAGLALSVSPGPSMLYVLSRSVGQSRMAGLASAIGLGIGGVILAVLAALGLAAVFQNSATAQTVLKYAGSAYLIYLGVQMAAEAVGRSEPDDLVVSEVKKASFFSIVWQGVLVEVLNPKTIIFFVLFIPPFVDANGGGDVVTQLLILGALVPLTAIPSDVFVAYLGGSVAETVRSRPAVGNTLSILGGVILIAIGLSLGLSD
ncbi:MAG: LysE family translocator [Pseudomonadota bacterium]